MTSPSAPVVVLTGFGAFMALLGLVVAGNLVVVGIGLGAVVVAGILDLVARLASRNGDRSTSLRDSHDSSSNPP